MAAPSNHPPHHLTLTLHALTPQQAIDREARALGPPRAPTLAAMVLPPRIQALRTCFPRSVERSKALAQEPTEAHLTDALILCFGRHAEPVARDLIFAALNAELRPGVAVQDAYTAVAGSFMMVVAGASTRRPGDIDISARVCEYNIVLATLEALIPALPNVTCTTTRMTDNWTRDGVNILPPLGRSMTGRSCTLVVTVAPPGEAPESFTLNVTERYIEWTPRDLVSQYFYTAAYAAAGPGPDGLRFYSTRAFDRRPSAHVTSVPAPCLLNLVQLAASKLLGAKTATAAAMAAAPMQLTTANAIALLGELMALIDAVANGRGFLLTSPAGVALLCAPLASIGAAREAQVAAVVTAMPALRAAIPPVPPTVAAAAAAAQTFARRRQFAAAVRRLLVRVLKEAHAGIVFDMPWTRRDLVNFLRQGNCSSLPSPCNPKLVAAALSPGAPPLPSPAASAGAPPRPSHATAVLVPRAGSPGSRRRRSKAAVRLLDTVQTYVRNSGVPRALMSHAAEDRWSVVYAVISALGGRRDGNRILARLRSPLEDEARAQSALGTAEGAYAAHALCVCSVGGAVSLGMRPDVQAIFHRAVERAVKVALDRVLHIVSNFDGFRDRFKDLHMERLETTRSLLIFDANGRCVAFDVPRFYSRTIQMGLLERKPKRRRLDDLGGSGGGGSGGGGSGGDDDVDDAGGSGGSGSGSGIFGGDNDCGDDDVDDEDDGFGGSSGSEGGLSRSSGQSNARVGQTAPVIDVETFKLSQKRARGLVEKAQGKYKPGMSRFFCIQPYTTKGSKKHWILSSRGLAIVVGTILTRKSADRVALENLVVQRLLALEQPESAMWRTNYAPPSVAAGAGAASQAAAVSGGAPPPGAVPGGVPGRGGAPLPRGGPPAPAPPPGRGGPPPRTAAADRKPSDFGITRVITAPLHFRGPPELVASRSATLRLQLNAVAACSPRSGVIDLARFLLAAEGHGPRPFIDLEAGPRDTFGIAAIDEFYASLCVGRRNYDRSPYINITQPWHSEVLRWLIAEGVPMDCVDRQAHDTSILRYEAIMHRAHFTLSISSCAVHGLPAALLDNMLAELTHGAHAALLAEGAHSWTRGDRVAWRDRLLDVQCGSFATDSARAMRNAVMGLTTFENRETGTSSRITYSREVNVILMEPFVKQIVEVYSAWLWGDYPLPAVAAERTAIFTARDVAARAAFVASTASGSSGSWRHFALRLNLAPIRGLFLKRYMIERAEQWRDESALGLGRGSVVDVGSHDRFTPSPQDPCDVVNLEDMEVQVEQLASETQDSMGEHTSADAPAENIRSSLATDEHGRFNPDFLYPTVRRLVPLPKEGSRCLRMDNSTCSALYSANLSAVFMLAPHGHGAEGRMGDSIVTDGWMLGTVHKLLGTPRQQRAKRWKEAAVPRYAPPDARGTSVDPGIDILAATASVNAGIASSSSPIVHHSKRREAWRADLRTDRRIAEAAIWRQPIADELSLLRTVTGSTSRIGRFIQFARVSQTVGPAIRAELLKSKWASANFYYKMLAKRSLGLFWSARTVGTLADGSFDRQLTIFYGTGWGGSRGGSTPVVAMLRAAEVAALSFPRRGHAVVLTDERGSTRSCGAGPQGFQGQACGARLGTVLAVPSRRDVARHAQRVADSLGGTRAGPWDLVFPAPPRPAPLAALTVLRNLQWCPICMRFCNRDGDAACAIFWAGWCRSMGMEPPAAMRRGYTGGGPLPAPVRTSSSSPRF